MKLKLKVHKFTYLSIIALFAILLPNCSDKDKDIEGNIYSDGIQFIGYLSDNAVPRVNSRGDKEIHAVTVETCETPYYITLKKRGNETDNVMGPFPYKVPAGRQGELGPVSKDYTLNWIDQTTEHDFWAWTMPWVKDNTEVTNENIPVYFPHPGSKAEPNEIGVIVSDYTENNLYESFFGASSGPYAYRTHGQYVDLEFYHLVSKIIIDEVVLNFTSLNVRRITSYDITLFRVPVQGTFFPVPIDNQGNAALPYVNTKLDITGKESNNLGNIKFSFGDTPGNVMYVAPEIDLQEISFGLKITDQAPDLAEYRNNTEYFGTFANIKFNRTGPTTSAGGPYDDVENQSDLTTLHAGEEMHLSMVVTVGQTPGVGVNIPKWYLQDENPAVSHTRPGIYTNGEMNDVLSGGRSDTDVHLNYYYELYGSKNPDDPNHRYFQLYDDLTVSGNFLPCYDPYVVDGGGHLITLTGGNQTIIYIENYRNIYISQGDHLLYIDSDGNVFLLDPETFEVIEKSETKMADIGKDQQMSITYNPLKVVSGKRGTDAPREQ